MFLFRTAEGLKSELKDYLAQNRVKLVFSGLKPLFKGEEDIYNEIIGLEGQWAQAEKQSNLGVAENEQTNRTKNRIRQALADYIDRVDDRLVWKRRIRWLLRFGLPAIVIFVVVWALMPPPAPACIPDNMTRKLVHKEGETGYLDNCNEFVIPPRYQNGNPFTEGFAAVAQNDRWGFIDLQGNIQVSFRYEMAESFSEGLAAVKKDGLWGFVNYNGEEIIARKFENVSPFSDGLAAVKMNSKWGYVDKTGSVVIPFLYGSAASFEGGNARVTIGDSVFVIDRLGSRH